MTLTELAQKYRLMAEDMDEIRIETAKSFLDATTYNPGPPVGGHDDKRPGHPGKLERSGTAYVGGRVVASNGEIPPQSFEVNKDPAVITIVYSAIEPVKSPKGADKYFVFRGTKWFDYAEKQHIEHAQHKRWVSLTMLHLGRIIEDAVGVWLRRHT